MLTLPFETINSGTDITIGLDANSGQTLAVQLKDNSSFTGTLAFKVSVDGVNFVAIEGYTPADPATGIETLADAAATGIVVFDVTGFSQFLLEVTYTSGTVKVAVNLATHR